MTRQTFYQRKKRKGNINYNTRQKDTMGLRVMVSRSQRLEDSFL